MMPPTNETGEYPRGWSQSSTCRATEDEGRNAGRAYGLAESASQSLAFMLRGQAKRRFGSDNGDGSTTLDALAQGFARDRLEVLGDRLLDSADWGAWLAGVEPPPPAPGPPEYACELDFELELSNPSIDTEMIFEIPPGQKTVVRLRLQKWYQPELGKVLFEEGLRLERQHQMPVMIAVILMWPSSDGPDVTGSYEGILPNGRRKTLHYQVRRAWEMEPEEALNSPGTVMLAPLCRGARERLPEILQSIDAILSRSSLTDSVRGLLWPMTYWSMGIICTVDETIAYMGDRMQFVRSAPCFLSALGSAFQDGHSQALRDGPILAARALVTRQASRRFGEEIAAGLVAKADTFEALSALGERIAADPSFVPGRD